MSIDLHRYLRYKTFIYIFHWKKMDANSNVISKQYVMENIKHGLYWNLNLFLVLLNSYYKDFVSL